MKITKLGYIKRKVTQRLMTLEAVVSLIKSDGMRARVADFRERLQRAYPMRQYPFTQKVPKLLFAGEFRDGEMLAYSGLVLLEVDNLMGRQDAEQVRDAVAGYPQTLIAMVGASGRSVKFVVPYTLPDGSLPKKREQAELFHAHAYRHAMKTYEPRIQYPISLKEPTLDRYCRLSYDGGVYYNPDAMAVHLEQPASMPDMTYHQETSGVRQQSAPQGLDDYSLRRHYSMQYEIILERALDTMDNLRGKVDFKPTLVGIARDCFLAGIEEEDCAVWTLTCFGGYMDEVEIRKTVNHIYRIEHGFGTKEFYDTEMQQALRMEEFMNRRYRFRYNTMSGGTEYKENNTFRFRYLPVNDRVYNSIALNAQKEGLQLWDRDVRRYVNSDRVPQYAPIEDWLARLPEWDGTDRIAALARRVPCDNTLWEHWFRLWFLSMVAHWQGRDTTHSNSVSPLLVGGQGCGKSSFCLSLLPPELAEYYTDSIDFSKKRDAELYLTRFALINIDEFDQVSERHQGFLKHLLQKPVVNIRKPFAAQVEAMKRYASFIATSNHADLLNDPTGSRRFICITVTGMIDNTQPLEHAQLYAQAIAALDAGERYWLTHDEEQLLMSDNEEFRQRPFSEDIFYRYYRPATHKDEGVKMTAGEIYHALSRRSGEDLPKSKLGRFGRFLRNAVPVQTKSNRGTLYSVVEE